LWHVWKEGYSKLVVVQKVNSWEMCNDEESETQHGKAFHLQVKVVRKDEMVESAEELCDWVETVKGFSYLGGKVNASG